MQPTTLAVILDQDRNSFGAVRLCLALSVLVSHAFPLVTGVKADDPVMLWTGFSLGDHAVHMFFVISGIVTAASLARTRSVTRFLAARVLRIVPAVAVFAILFALLVTPWLSPLALGDYLTSREVPAFVLRTATFAPGHPPLPGVFTLNPMSGVIDEPLWTVKYELVCYLALATVGMLLLARSRATLLAVALTIVTLFVATSLVAPSTGHEQLDHLRKFAACFALGVAGFLAADRIPLTGIGAALAVALYVILMPTPLMPAATILAAGYLVVWLASLSFGDVRAAANRWDLSYGIYIMHWPIGQALVATIPGISVPALIAASIAITVPLAFASWVLVERPALALRHRVGAWRWPVSSRTAP